MSVAKRTLAVCAVITGIICILLLNGCSAPKQLDPSVNKFGMKLFEVAKAEAQKIGGSLNERGTEFRDLGGYVPAQIMVESNESEEKFISSKDFKVSSFGAGKTYYGIDDLAMGSYRANKYEKYFVFFAGDASGKIIKYGVKSKTRYLVQELSDGKPTGSEEFGDWDDEWNLDEEKSLNFINAIRAGLNLPECNSAENIYCSKK